MKIQSAEIFHFLLGGVNRNKNYDVILSLFH